MNVMIGVDPHKVTHTAVAIGKDEDQIASVKVRATLRQVDQLLTWAEPSEKRTWAVESVGGMGICSLSSWWPVARTFLTCRPPWLRASGCWPLSGRIRTTRTMLTASLRVYSLAGANCCRSFDVN